MAPAGDAEEDSSDAAVEADGEPGQLRPRAQRVLLRPPPGRLRPDPQLLQVREEMRGQMRYDATLRDSDLNVNGLILTKEYGVLF